MEQEIENFNSQNEEGIVPENNEPGLPADPIEVEPIDDDVEEKEMLKQRNQELYEQLKKAKGFIRDKDGKWIKKEQPPQPVEKDGMAGITTEELYSLVKANVPDEDTKEVKLYARSHGLSITEALKIPEVKSLLSIRKEYRTTAEATNAGGSRRGSTRISDETLLANASKGIIPTSEEDMVRLIKARKGIKD